MTEQIKCNHTLIEDEDTGLIQCIKCNKAEVELLE